MPRISAAEREVTRSRLVDAAKTEFATRGLAGARFDVISTSAGHAKGTIYNYFDSKESLFFAIVEEWCELLVQAAGAGPSGSAADRLVELARIDTEIARKDPELALVVVQHMPALVGQHREAALAAISAALDLVAAAFDDGLALGEFASPHDGLTLARLFLGVLSGFEVEALQPEPTVSLDDVVELVSLHFLQGLRPQTANRNEP